ncbi:CopK family periplasmic copper-binding protein [Rhodoferax sp.]|uniref:CopK family periplasmic copper-binding protein n=2 Tax=Rhodoferax sp. TaxID=50421 RepID=UPI0025EE1603|nr:CopK family periplasmic copper-binding protein [Rhodoferax sp.]
MQLSGLNSYIKTSDAVVALPVLRNTSGDVSNQLEGVFIMSIRKSIIALSLVLPALSVFALDNADIAKSVQLKDGSTMHQFKDGKMSMEDKYGRAVRMKEGMTMETIDGKSVTMNGDEVGKLYGALQAHKQN